MPDQAYMAVESCFGTGACPPLEGGKEFENINCFERDAGIQMCMGFSHVLPSPRMMVCTSCWQFCSASQDIEIWIRDSESFQ